MKELLSEEEYSNSFSVPVLNQELWQQQIIMCISLLASTHGGEEMWSNELRLQAVMWHPCSPWTLKSSRVFHPCEMGEAEWLLCLCNPWSGLGYCVNAQQHNAPLLCSAMVWVSATITSAVGGWVKDWKMFHKKNIMRKYWQCKFSQIKKQRKTRREGKRRVSRQTDSLREHGNLCWHLLMNMEEFCNCDETSKHLKLNNQGGWVGLGPGLER